mmetsp:Transcript_37881/g.59108  ORF Transcript_37881/g.59108 Transcript_37881/m.59108 type:complete len:143 (-) Transcript_37881:1090-1518(-)
MRRGLVGPTVSFAFGPLPCAPSGLSRQVFCSSAEPFGGQHPASTCFASQRLSSLRWNKVGVAAVLAHWIGSQSLATTHPCYPLARLQSLSLSSQKRFCGESTSLMSGSGIATRNYTLTPFLDDPFALNRGASTSAGCLQGGH